MQLIAHNLEHGNIASMSEFDGNLEIKYSFSTKDQPSYEYLKDRDVFKVLIEKLSFFSGVTKDKIRFLLELSDAEGTSFADEKKKLFLKDEVIKEAEKIFGLNFTDIITK